MSPPPPRPASATRPAPGVRGALVIAAVSLALIERVVPHGRVALYPFVLFATWVHEMGHGLAALLTGGRFSRLDIFADASGMAHIAVAPGAPTAVSAAAGLLAPPLVGALLFGVGRGPRRARGALALIAVALGVSLALWIRGPIGMLSTAGVALALVAAARWTSDRAAVVSVQFLALLLGVDAVRRGDYLFTSSALVGGRVHPSDVSAVAGVWGGSHLLWGALLAALGALVFGVGLWSAWRAPRAAQR